MLERLRAMEPAVRADVLRVLECVVRELPAHWRRRREVPRLMVFLDGPQNVRMERTSLRELGQRYGYLDESSRWAGSVPGEKAREHGCAALVYGDGIHQRINRIGPYGSALHRPDIRADARVSHRDMGLNHVFNLHFDVKGVLFPRLVFREGVFEAPARARQG